MEETVPTIPERMSHRNISLQQIRTFPCGLLLSRDMGDSGRTARFAAARNAPRCAEMLARRGIQKKTPVRDACRGFVLTASPNRGRLGIRNVVRQTVAHQSQASAGLVQCLTSAITAPKPTNTPPVSRLKIRTTRALRSDAPIRVPNAQ